MIYEPPDKLTYRCNGCGHKHSEPHFCECCGTPMCPECKRAGCIVNLVEMERALSHSLEQRGSLKRSHKTKKKVSKDPQQKLRELQEQLDS